MRDKMTPSFTELNKVILENVANQNIVLALINEVLKNMKTLPKTEPYSAVFDNLILNKCIEDDEACKEYRKGTIEFYTLLNEKLKCCEKIPLVFPLENATPLPNESKQLFQTNLIIGCTLKNKEYMVMAGFNGEQVDLLEELGGVCVMQEKHLETFAKLEKIGIHHLFS